MKQRKKPAPHKRPVSRRDLNMMLVRLAKSAQFPIALSQSIDTVLEGLDVTTANGAAQLCLVTCSARLLARELRTVRDWLAMLNETNARGNA